MKTLVMHRKITLSIFAMIVLLCGLGGVSYAQVCKVGDVLFPGQGCSDPSVGYFSVLADGSASIGGATLNAANINWNAFSAKNLGNAWEITAVTGGAPPEPTGPEVLVVDPDAPPIYWTNYDTDKIQRANLDGSDVQDLVTQGLGGPFGIALDVVGGKMYWTDIYTDKIQRANLDGSNIEDLVTQGLSGPNGIALDVVGGKMYWTDSRAEKIQRANLDGSNIEDLVTQGLEWTGDIALDVVGGKMYWVDYHTKKIQRANLDGSNIEDLVTQGLSGPNGIALDVEGGKMYWTDSSRAEKIQRANLDGSNIEDLVTQGLRGPYGIALDVAGGKMYWTDEGAYKIQRANLDGSNVEDLVIELREPGGIALAIPATHQPTSQPTPQPDLVIQSLRSNKSALAPGERFTLSATVRNRGKGRALSTTLRYYRSPDATISSRDTQVGTDGVGALGVNRAGDESISLTAPTSPGTYYYGVCVDSVTDESDTANNCSTAVSVTVTAPPVVDPEAPLIYWTDFETKKIQRANLDGSNVQDLITQGLGAPGGIALDVTGGKMYWADWGTAKIQRANLDGSNVQDLVNRIDRSIRHSIRRGRWQDVLDRLWHG